MRRNKKPRHRVRSIRKSGADLWVSGFQLDFHQGVTKDLWIQFGVRDPFVSHESTPDVHLNEPAQRVDSSANDTSLL